MNEFLKPICYPMNIQTFIDIFFRIHLFQFLHSKAYLITICTNEKFSILLWKPLLPRDAVHTHRFNGRHCLHESVWCFWRPQCQDISPDGLHARARALVRSWIKQVSLLLVTDQGLYDRWSCGRLMEQIKIFSATKTDF